MNKIQEYQFEIAKEFDRICRKHKINYSLDGGSLLGAIRHKGFIPWDDDLDIIMYRKDYEKFLKIAEAELDKRYFLQNTNTDSYYGNIFSKIRLNNSKYIEQVSKNVKAHDGIYIDIFVFDDAKNDNKDNLKTFKKVLFLRMLLLIKCKYIIKCDSLLKKIEVLILKMLSIFTKRNRILKKIDDLIFENSCKNSKDVIIYPTVYFSKYKYERKLLSEYCEVTFENYSFKAFKNYDEYLKILYGDYMKLPPKEQQHGRHDIIEWELPKE